MENRPNAASADISADDDFMLEMVRGPIVFLNLDKPQKLRPAPKPSVRSCLSEVINLSGEVHSLTSVNPSDFRLTDQQRAELLSLNTSQRFCLRFFQIFGVTTTPQIRIDGKRHFIRLSINNGEHIIEEELVTFGLSRSAVAIKAVKMFNPEIAREWLQKYKKQKRAIASHFD